MYKCTSAKLLEPKLKRKCKTNSHQCCQYSAFSQILFQHNDKLFSWTRPLQIEVAVHFQRWFHTQALPRTQSCRHHHLHLPVQQTHCRWPTAWIPALCLPTAALSDTTMHGAVSVSQGSAPRMMAGTNCRYEVDWVTEYACHRDYLESHSCKLSSEQHDLSIDLTPLTLSCKYSSVSLLCSQVRPTCSSTVSFVSHSSLPSLLYILQKSLFLFCTLLPVFFFSHPAWKRSTHFYFLLMQKWATLCHIAWMMWCACARS